MIIDLHTHSSISDGSYSPEDLIDAAIDSGIGMVALCDHDTTGNKRFLTYAEKKGIKAIQGIEMTCAWDNGTFHVLGLGVSQDYAPLEKMLEKVRSSRSNRNISLLDQLASKGVYLTLDEVGNISGSDIICKPHIASILVFKGYADNIKEAFDKYLVCDAPSRYKPLPEEAIKILKKAGAKPIIAHPTLLNRSIEELDEMMPLLKKAGLWGLEVHTPYTPISMIGKYLELAERHNLGITAGSDFHGYCKPNHLLGRLEDGSPILNTLSTYCK